MLCIGENIHPFCCRMLQASVLLFLVNAVLCVCPPDCLCIVDDKNRRQILCTKGAMMDPIPTAYMDLQLQVIHISAPLKNKNHLTIGPVFQNFSRLEQLHITYSNIPTIGRHSFWGVPTLKQLNLSHNNITQLLENNFRGLINLLELYLDYNRIESMTSGTFRHLPELMVLSLTRNRISELAPRLFLGLGKLHQFHLSGNAVEELNTDVFKDVQARKLDCYLILRTIVNRTKIFCG